MAWPVVSRSGLFAVALSLAAMPASAELVLPPAWASASSRSRAPGSARVPRVLRQGRPAGPARVQPRVARPGPGPGRAGGPLRFDPGGEDEAREANGQDAFDSARARPGAGSGAGPAVGAHQRRRAPRDRGRQARHRARAANGRVKRVVYPPGFRWSTHIRPIVGTEYCMHAHVGFLARGRVQGRYRDGCAFEIVAPQVVAIEPGHDAWVTRTEAAVLIELDAQTDTA